MKFKKAAKAFVDSQSTGGRTYLVCSIILFFVAVATFSWLLFNVEEQNMLRYILYSSSMVLLTLGLVVFSAFAFSSPRKAAKFLWIPIALAALTFIGGLLLPTTPSTSFVFENGTPGISVELE